MSQTIRAVAHYPDGHEVWIGTWDTQDCPDWRRQLDERTHPSHPSIMARLFHRKGGSATPRPNILQEKTE